MEDDEYRDNHKDYEEICIFLKNHELLFDFKLIDFFSSQCFLSYSGSIMNSFKDMDYAYLNIIPLGYIHEDWPDDIVSFLRTANKLGNKRFNYKKPNNIVELELDAKFLTGMSAKKMHEVERMASFVHKLAEENHLDKIIDAGSGMGYLSRILAHKYGYSVIALEGNQCISDNSSYWHKAGLLKFICLNYVLTSSEESIGNLEKNLRQTWPEISDSDGILLLGLHCCADLTPCMISIFKKIKYIKALVCVSCCYHRMKTIDGVNFVNFPLSDILKYNLKKSNFQVNLYSLRLASQETRAKWQCQSMEDHEYHLKSFAYRCIIEIFTFKYDIKLRKKRRKYMWKKVNDFESFLKFHGYSEYSRNLIEIYEEYKDQFNIIEPFTMLQVLFQPILEHLITMDRVEYLKQLGFPNTEPYILFDDLISPRNIAIVSIK